MFSNFRTIPVIFILPVCSSKHFNDRLEHLSSVVYCEKPLMRNSCSQRKVERSNCGHERCAIIPAGENIKSESHPKLLSSIF